MASSDEQVESLSRKIEERERQSRRRALVLTLIPVVFAGLFLAYTVWQISIIDRKLVEKTDLLSKAEKTQVVLNTSVPKAEMAVAAAETAQGKLQSDLSQAQLELSQFHATATAQFSEMQKELDAARVFARNTCPIDEMAFKEFASDYTPQAKLLVFLFEAQQRRIPWNPSGFSEADGFDSPNFALFVLQNAIPGVPLVSPDLPPGTRPWNILSPIPTPLQGDIVFYKSGYTMFYYTLPARYGSLDQTQCVIGMTPVGILSLEMNFAEQPRALQVPYPPYP